MPDYVVSKVADALNDECKSVKGSSVLILGVAYKPNVSDVRESPAIDVIHLLQERGAEVQFNDPYVSDLSHEGIDLAGTDLTDDLVRKADCVLIVTHHADFDWESIANNARLIVDTRHVIKKKGGGRVVYL
jgi:UDP-N-acetyl-D-glucosamine dehydrogenase